MQESYSSAETEPAIWPWVVLGFLLGLGVTLNLTELIPIKLRPAYLLPLLTAGLAARFGHRAILPIVTFGLLAIFALRLNIEYILRIDLEIPGTVYLLAVAAALAFYRPATPEVAPSALQPYWRWCVWTGLAALWLAVLSDWRVPLAPDGGIRMRVDMGALLFLVAVAAALRREWWLTLWQRRGGDRAALLMLVAAIALLVDIRYGGDVLSFGFGLVGARAVFYVACFALAAWRILDWRLMLALLVAVYLGDDWVTRLWEAVATSPESAGDGAVRESRPRADGEYRRLIYGLSAIVLGATIAPFWRTRHSDTLRYARTPLLLAAVLALQFAALPAAVYGSGFSLALGGTAFIAGLVWRVPGMLLAPIIIQLSYLLSYVSFGEPMLSMRPAVAMAYLGCLAFTFGYAGLLCNRRAGSAAPPA